MVVSTNVVNTTTSGFQSFTTTLGQWHGRTFQSGTGMSISNADGIAGDPTFNVTGGGVTWVDATSSTQALEVNKGYVTDRGGGVTYTLPATASLGDCIQIMGKTGAWTVNWTTNQQVLLGTNPASVTTGTISSTDSSDCITLICITAGASTIWRAQSAWGNIAYT